MPKIFLLKNRLQEQQARLLEAQKGNERNDLDELSDKPVPLVTKSVDILKDSGSSSGTGQRKFISGFFRVSRTMPSIARTLLP